MLDLNEAKLVEIAALAGHEVERDTLVDYLRGEEEAGYQACGDDTMLRLLDGLVIHRRGRMEAPADAPPPERRMSNNLALKKLRVAFELKQDDMHQVFALAGYEISKPELSALFRKKGQSNYRACGDQVLRYFLKGLTMRLRRA